MNHDVWHDPGGLWRWGLRPKSGGKNHDPKASRNRRSALRACGRIGTDQFECRPGCGDCCLVDLSVFPVEAALVRQAFAELPDATRKAAAERASLDRHCCMLDPTDGRCIVYHARPVICRSHGLTVLIDGNLDHCPKNYGDRPAARDCILDLEKLNTALVSVNMASGGDANRVRMADIALESK